MIKTTNLPSFIYHVYPLGALGAETHNHPSQSPIPRLQHLQEWIPHWKALGVDTILFGPLFSSESHGYDTQDPLRVDPRLGNEEDLYRLVSTLKNQGFKVLFDGVFNHTGRSFQVFQELLNSDGHCEKASWYKDVKPGISGPGGAPFSYRGWNGHASLPEFNLQNPTVREFLLKTVGEWMDRYGIDGLRLDAADVLDFNFMKELSTYCRQKNPEFWLLGEVIHGEYNRWVDDAGLDSVTNYELYKSLWSSLNDKNFFELTWTLERHFGPRGLCRNFQPMTFLDNHDVSKIASVLKDPAHLDLVWDLSFLVPGIPSLYYGSEWDWKASKGSGDDWNLRPKCHPTENYHSPSRVPQLGHLAAFRKNHPALFEGSYELIGNTGTLLGFIRSSSIEKLLILVNAQKEEAVWNPQKPLRNLRQIWGSEVGVNYHGPHPEFTLPGFNVSVFVCG